MSGSSVSCLMAALPADSGSSKHEEHGPPACVHRPASIFIRSALGPFTAPDFFQQTRRAQGLLQSGIPAHLRVCEARRRFALFVKRKQRDSDVRKSASGAKPGRGESDLNWTMGPDEAAVGVRGRFKKASGLAAAHATACRARAPHSSNDPSGTSSTSTPAKRVDQDRAFADAMKKVADAYSVPTWDAATIYAEAFYFCSKPRAPARATSRVPNVPADRRRPRARESRPTSITPPARVIYTIHITEATTEPERAVTCAEVIGSEIPGASHINHMPSHTWTQIGRWGRWPCGASLDAWHSDLKIAGWRGHRDLYSVARPAHAYLRGVDGWTRARYRDSKPGPRLFAAC